MVEMMVTVMERRQEESVVVLEDTDSNLGPKLSRKMSVIYRKLTWMRSGASTEVFLFN